MTGALLVACGAVAIYGYRANWDRYLHYRHLPDFQRHTEAQLIRRLDATPLAERQVDMASAPPLLAQSGAAPVLATPATVAQLAPATPTPVVDPATLPNGRVTDSATFSPALRRKLAYRIYLPPGYDDPRLAAERYPVVYLLHGAPGGYHDWVDGANANQVADALIKTRTIAPVILVMPDGSLGNPHHDTQWANSPVTGERVEDALVQDLVPAIDQAYRTIPVPAARGIGGLSSGGFGAVNIALHHPDQFAATFSLSGYFSPEKTYDGVDLWGSDAARAANSPLREADHQSLRIYLAVGQSDHQYLGQAQAFDQVLSARGITHRLESFPGAHGWEFWQSHLVDALRYTVPALVPQAQGDLIP